MKSLFRKQHESYIIKSEDHFCVQRTENEKYVGKRVRKCNSESTSVYAGQWPAFSTNLH